MLDDYYGADDASRILGVHPETVKRLCRSGDITASKFRNCWLIHADELDQFKKQYNPNPGRRPIGETKVKGLPS